MDFSTHSSSSIRRNVQSVYGSFCGEDPYGGTMVYPFISQGNPIRDSYVGAIPVHIKTRIKFICSIALMVSLTMVPLFECKDTTGTALIPYGSHIHEISTYRVIYTVTIYCVLLLLLMMSCCKPKIDRYILPVITAMMVLTVFDVMYLLTQLTSIWGYLSIVTGIIAIYLGILTIISARGFTHRKNHIA